MSSEKWLDDTPKEYSREPGWDSGCWEQESDEEKERESVPTMESEKDPLMAVARDPLMDIRSEIPKAYLSHGPMELTNEPSRETRMVRMSGSPMALRSVLLMESLLESMMDSLRVPMSENRMDLS